MIKKRKSMLAIIIVVLCIIFTVLVVFLGVILINDSRRATVDEKLYKANIYYEKMKYDKAIVAYEEVIYINQKATEAYCGLAKVYIAKAEECIERDNNNEAIEQYQLAIDMLDRSVDCVDSTDEIDFLRDKCLKSMEAFDNEYVYENNSDSNEMNDIPNEDIGCKLFIKTYDANLSSDGSNSNISDVAIKLIKGFNNENGNVLYDGITARDGSITFEPIEKGEYTIVFEKTGFVATYENIYITEDTQFLKYIPRESGKNDLVVIAEWKGNYDLDICFFNAKTKERISCGNPMDKSESFIYCDNQNLHYEMLYLRNFNEEEVRSIYLVDVNGVKTGKSLMEADGAKISIYQGSSCIYQKDADSSKSEPIWNPVYIYSGEVYENDICYHTANEADNDWALHSKDGVSTAEWINQYKNLIDSVDKAKGARVANGNKGKEYQYYFFDIENDGIPELFIEEKGYGKVEFYDGDIGLSSDKLYGYTFSDGQVTEFFNRDFGCDICGENELLGIYFDRIGYFTLDEHGCNENLGTSVYLKNGTKLDIAEYEYSDYGTYRYENLGTGKVVVKEAVDEYYFSSHRIIAIKNKIKPVLYSDIIKKLDSYKLYAE